MAEKHPVFSLALKKQHVQTPPCILAYSFFIYLGTLDEHFSFQLNDKTNTIKFCFASKCAHTHTQNHFCSKEC